MYRARVPSTSKARSSSSADKLHYQKLKQTHFAQVRPNVSNRLHARAPRLDQQNQRHLPGTGAASPPVRRPRNSEVLLQVGRRRAQQILAPCVSGRVGASGPADPDTVIKRLKEIAAGQEETV
jgi:hypothetical protein